MVSNLDDEKFWVGKKVLVTGHTGFKGGWLSLWLEKKGAIVTGFALPPEGDDSLYYSVRIEKYIDSRFGDVRDFESLRACVQQSSAEIIFNLAAQPIVSEGYAEPRSTFETNVMGSVNILDAARRSDTVKVIVNVTTDKVYENKNWHWGYREIDGLGGADPYSASKAAAEIVTDAYRQAFFSKRNVGIASARAGNVIGGGDWSQDRLIPDVIRTLHFQKPLWIRKPGATRPWQHVLDPLSGYMKLAEYLSSQPIEYSGAWNFGPYDTGNKTVMEVLEEVKRFMKEKKFWKIHKNPNLSEANTLHLDSRKSRLGLSWEPNWEFEVAVAKTLEWYNSVHAGECPFEITINQINDYERTMMQKKHIGLE